MAITAIKKPGNTGFGTTSLSSSATKLKNQILTATKQASAPKTSYSSTPTKSVSAPRTSYTSTNYTSKNSGMPSTQTKAATSVKSRPSTSLPSSISQLNQNPAIKAQAQANAAAAASGGSTSTPPDFSGGTDPSFPGKSGFAKSITELGRQPLFQDPSALARAWFDYNKMDANGGLLALMQQNVAPSLLLYHTLFGDQDPSSGTGQWGPYADFSDAYMNRAMTPGGAYYTADQILNALQPNKDTSPLIFQQLYGSELTPAQQAYRYNQAYGSAMAPNTAEEVLGVQMAYLNTLAEEFTAAKARGEVADMNFGQYLASKGWG